MKPAPRTLFSRFTKTINSTSRFYQNFYFSLIFAVAYQGNLVTFWGHILWSVWPSQGNFRSNLWAGFTPSAIRVTSWAAFTYLRSGITSWECTALNVSFSSQAIVCIKLNYKGAMRQCRFGEIHHKGSILKVQAQTISSQTQYSCGTRKKAFPHLGKKVSYPYLNRAPSYFGNSHFASSCQKSDKTNEPITRIAGNRHTNGQR